MEPGADFASRWNTAGRDDGAVDDERWGPHEEAATDDLSRVRDVAGLDAWALGAGHVAHELEQFGTSPTAGTEDLDERRHHAASQLNR